MPSTQTILHLLYWVPAFLPGLTIVLIWWGYNRMLKLKLFEVRGIMDRPDISYLYAQAFAKPSENSNAAGGQTSYLTRFYRWIKTTLRTFVGSNGRTSSPADD